MNPIVNLKTLPERLRSLGQRVIVAVASPADAHTEEVIERSVCEGFADFILTAVEGKQAIAEQLAARHPQQIKIIKASDDDDAARKAVLEVREARADVLMKGSLNTDNLLRAVLNKEQGILVKGSVLTHIAVAEIPGMNRLMLFSDAAVIPFPTTEQLDAVLTYITKTWRSLTGGSCPRVALTHCTEKTSDKFPITLAYQAIKTACDAESGAIKGISSPVVGNADILIFPDIEAGNTFYKTITFFANATVAGMLDGTTAPVVVTSRADSADSKFYSLAVACMRSISPK